MPDGMLLSHHGASGQCGHPYDTETDTIDSPTENLGQVWNLSELELEVRSQLFYISPGHSLLYFALILFLIQCSVEQIYPCTCQIV